MGAALYVHYELSKIIISAFPLVVHATVFTIFRNRQYLCRLRIGSFFLCCVLHSFFSGAYRRHMEHFIDDYLDGIHPDWRVRQMQDLQISWPEVFHPNSQTMGVFCLIAQAEKTECECFLCVKWISSRSSPW